MKCSQADRCDEGGGQHANHTGVQAHELAREVLLAVQHPVRGAW